MFVGLLLLFVVFHNNCTRNAFVRTFSVGHAHASISFVDENFRVRTQKKAPSNRVNLQISHKCTVWVNGGEKKKVKAVAFMYIVHIVTDRVSISIEQCTTNTIWLKCE